eukprot:scaffold45980_cov33-Tisochrysis_lutea.AAC.2
MHWCDDDPGLGHLISSLMCALNLKIAERCLNWGGHHQFEIILACGELLNEESVKRMLVSRVIVVFFYTTTVAVAQPGEQNNYHPPARWENRLKAAQKQRMANSEYPLADEFTH